MSENTKLECLVLFGAASVHTYRFLLGISPHFNRVHLVTDGVLPNEFRPANLAQTLLVDFSIYNFRAEKKIRQFLIRTAPDVAHIHQANTLAFHSLRATKRLCIPSVLTAWGSEVLLLPEKNRLMKWMVRFNLRLADWITSDSHFMTSKIKLLAGSNVHVSTINFGIDSKLLSVDIEEKKKRIFSSRLHSKLYRVDSIIRAFVKLKSSGNANGWVLTIAGSGEETENLIRLAREINTGDDIEFVGFLSQEKLAGYYQNSSLFVSVPESDATSISLLEAMSAGCIPIVSNLPSNLEWIMDEISGFVVDDQNALASIFQKAINKTEAKAEWSQMAELNRRVISSKADFKRNMLGYAEILSNTSLRVGTSTNTKSDV